MISTLNAKLICNIPFFCGVTCICINLQNFRCYFYILTQLIRETLIEIVIIYEGVVTSQCLLLNQYALFIKCCLAVVDCENYKLMI